MNNWFLNHHKQIDKITLPVFILLTLILIGMMEASCGNSTLLNACVTLLLIAGAIIALSTGTYYILKIAELIKKSK